MIKLSLVLVLLVVVITTIAHAAGLFFSGGAGNGYYVAINGNDSNAGDINHPFATLLACQTAMQGGSIKTCYIRAGTYTPASTGTNCGAAGDVLDLGSSDNGETWSYYPPDGYNTAIINGQSTSGSNGLFQGICSTATNLTVNGLYFENYRQTGIGSQGANSIIENNIINTMTESGGPTPFCISAGGSNSQFVHNVLLNCLAHGLAYYQGGGAQATNLLIAYNYIYGACVGGSDCGGIYLEPNGGSETGSVTVSYNYVQDVGAGGGGNPIYLDDLTSNVTVTGNVFHGTGYECLTFLHGGSNNPATGNICDLTTHTSAQIAGQQNISGTPTGNTFEHNLVLANQSGSSAGNGYGCNTGPCQLTVTDNGYSNYTGTGINYGGSFTDSNPTYYSSLPFTCGWEYTLPGGSPAYSSPTSFPTQPAGWGNAGFWGPPGFVIPQTGTVPSPPHTC